MNTIEKFDNYVMNTYGRFGVALEKGNERSCVDENGKNISISAAVSVQIPSASATVVGRTRSALR